MQTMSVSPPRPLTGEERAQMRKWLDIWRETGPLLEEERWRRVAALTDDDAWRIAQDLLGMWESHMTGDGGEGLCLQQRVFDRARRRCTRP